jgi:GH15 family glucan-1,4-alpha-glucosidase
VRLVEAGDEVIVTYEVKRSDGTANDQQLGNFPQAFSHIGLITAAWEIDMARGAA